MTTLEAGEMQMKQEDFPSLSQIAQTIEAMPIDDFTLLMSSLLLLGICPMCDQSIDVVGERKDSRGRLWCKQCLEQFDSIDWEERNNTNNFTL